MQALIDEDLVVGLATGVASGVTVPPELRSLPLSRLRFDGASVVDISARGAFFIDGRGRKHIVQAESTWPEVSCSWDDDLLLDTGTWRVMTAADRLDGAKRVAKARLAVAAEQARQAYITPGDGKAAIYALKRDEAQRWKAAVDGGGSPELGDYPWLAARATRLGVSGQVVADEWNARAAVWETAGRAIEDAYEAAIEVIDALDDGATESEVAAIVDAVTWE